MMFGPMRYIGNKQKLVPFIRSALEALGMGSGTACDPFAGTAAVSRFLKRHGLAVTCGDLMQYSYVLQRATVECDVWPAFAGLKDVVRERPLSLGAVLRHLNRERRARGPVYRQFSPAGPHGRRYFTPRNAAKMDAVRETILRWWRGGGGGRLTEEERYILLASLLEASDRVANTTGVYAAFVKTWQPNARRPLRLLPPPLVAGTGRRCQAHRADALDVVINLGPVDILYLDPPYNTRQYAAYYHIPELLASETPFPRLRGKTGLPPIHGKRSDWCRPGACEQALEALVALAPCRHILMSYNSEGIIPAAAIERIFKTHGRPGTYRALRQRYRRYRSDLDGQNRNYRGDVVMEVLHYVEKRRP